MCGLAGLFDASLSCGEDALRETAQRMGRTLVHRGPDDDGVWVDAAGGVALAHRRLAVIDLSPGGHQPMVSASGRYVLVYNGEIYNHLELRRDLEAAGHRFRSHSDTETLVEAIDAWGCETALRRANGMLALAVWDVAQRRLTLARDRMGIKPLYYGRLGGGLAFASELKALRAAPAFQAEVDRDALALFVQHSYVPAPYSIYRHVYKLPPGSWLSFTAGDDPAAVTPRAYWDLKEVAERGAAEPFGGSARDAVDQLQRLLAEAVRLRLMADVPLGAFLSGGVDSSTIVALMQQQLDRPARTFTIGFEEPQYNEADYARRVAEHLGTDHVSLQVTPRQARQVIPQLPALYDEPLADVSQIPTFLVSQLARQHVTVSLSGDGGDELFGGYDRYALAGRIWKRIGWLPLPLRRAAAAVLPAVRGLAGPWARKVQTLAELLPLADGRQLYARLHTHWKNPAQLVPGGRLPQTPFYDGRQWAGRGNLLEEMMYIDSVTYLPDDILAKVDRASMAVALEARVPLLDHHVVEFVWTLPAELKVRGGTTKWLLRQLLDRHLPRDLIERPKVGFGVPIDSWLRGPLRDWAEDLLDEARLSGEQFFDPRPIREKWQQHQSGRQDWHYYLWDVLMFQAWLGGSSSS